MIIRRVSARALLMLLSSRIVRNVSTLITQCGTRKIRIGLVLVVLGGGSFIGFDAVCAP